MICPEDLWTKARFKLSSKKNLYSLELLLAFLCVCIYIYIYIYIYICIYIYIYIYILPTYFLSLPLLTNLINLSCLCIIHCYFIKNISSGPFSFFLSFIHSFFLSIYLSFFIPVYFLFSSMHYRVPVEEFCTYFVDCFA